MLLQVHGWYVVPEYAVDAACTWLLGRREETYGWRRLYRQGVPAARSRGQQVWKLTFKQSSRRSDQTVWSEASGRQRHPRTSLSSATVASLRHATQMPSSLAYSSLFPWSYNREALPFSYPPNARAYWTVWQSCERSHPSMKDHRRTRVLFQRELDGEDQETR